MLNDKDTEIKTKYDDLSVDELKEVLKNNFFYTGEFSGADMEEMDQIMAALDAKEPMEPLYSAEESLKQFKETYAEELSSLGVRNTEEVIERIPAADSDGVRSLSETETVRPVRHRRLLRIALVAAAIVVIFVAVAATAYAMGYDIFGWVPKWNNDVLGFGDDAGATNDLHDSSQIPAALEQLEIDEPLYPTWLPDGFTREYFVIEMDPIFLHEGYSNGDRYLSITIEPQSQIGITNYQKDLNQPIEYTVRGITHFIVSDTSSYTATWQTERHLVQITGNISLEEMEQIINSVYGVEK